jgi:hypothetical protein
MRVIVRFRAIALGLAIKERATTDSSFFSLSNSALIVRTKCWPARTRCRGAIDRQPARSRCPISRDKRYDSIGSDSAHLRAGLATAPTRQVTFDRAV